MYIGQIKRQVLWDMGSGTIFPRLDYASGEKLVDQCVLGNKGHDLFHMAQSSRSNW